MTEDNENGGTIRPAEHRATINASGYLKRRFSLIVYPALLNAGSAIVVLMICYGLGAAVVAVVRPTYGLSNEVIRTAIGWLATLYAMMIAGISLQGLWYLTKSEVTAARRNEIAPSAQAVEQK